MFRNIPALTVAILTSCTTHAREAALFERNRSRLLGAKPTDIQRRSERDDTPEAEEDERSIVLSLQHDKRPVDPSRGFTFGSGADTEVDIALAARPGESGVSRLHFAIDIDTVTGKLILSNSSRNGTEVRSKTGRCKKQKRGDKIALLSGDVIRAGLVRLKVYIPPKTGASEGLFKTHLNMWRAALPKAVDVHAEQSAEPNFMTKINTTQLTLGPRQLGKGGFGSPNIIRVHPRMQIPSSFPYLVMDHVQNGCLDPSLPDTDTINNVFRQLFAAVSYLHGRGITHRDVKPENVLVQSLDPVHVVIADFDNAMWDIPLAQWCGTYMYVAPEVMEIKHASAADGRFYTNKVDVWSLGVMLLEYSALNGLPTQEIPSGRNSSWKTWFRSLLNCLAGPVKPGHQAFISEELDDTDLGEDDFQSVTEVAEDDCCDGLTE